MHATANQVCWVPIKDIVDTQEAGASCASEEENAAVLLASRGDGQYILLAGRERLRRLRELGQGCVDAVLSPTDRMDQRISRLLDKLMRGELHYLDEAEEYRSLLGGGISCPGAFGAHRALRGDGAQKATAFEPGGRGVRPFA